MPLLQTAGSAMNLSDLHRPHRRPSGLSFQGPNYQSTAMARVSRSGDTYIIFTPDISIYYRLRLNLLPGKRIVETQLEGWKLHLSRMGSDVRAVS